MDEIKALVQHNRHRLIVNVSDIHTHFRDSASRSNLFSILDSYPYKVNAFDSLVKFRVLLFLEW